MSSFYRVLSRPATIAEATAHYLETTYSRDEMDVAHGEGVTLADARLIIEARMAENDEAEMWDVIAEAYDREHADERYEQQELAEIGIITSPVRDEPTPSTYKPVTLAEYLAATANDTRLQPSIADKEATTPKARRKRVNSALARRRAAAGLVSC